MTLRKRATPFVPEVPDSYLQGEITGGEAARLLGVGAARWRQLTGSRADPNTDLGVGIVRPGVRGARWRLRDVLEYAMRTRRSITMPLPPLLPAPGRQARYTTIRGRVHDAAAAAELRLPRLEGADCTVWAQMFVPVTYDECGHKVGCVLLLTPLWPTEQHSLIYSPSLLAGAVRAALREPGWSGPLLQGRHPLTVAVLPTGTEHTWTPARNSVEVFEVDQELLANLQSHNADLDLNRELRRHHRDVLYSVDATDVAASLGMTALPWWPEGTATANTCARWASGIPVTITHPASADQRWEAAQWLVHHAPTADGPVDGVTRADHLHLARTIDPAHGQDANIRLRRPDLPEGFELAVTVKTQLPIDPGDDTAKTASPWRALDRVLGSSDTPPRVGAALLQWYGDPVYGRPAHLQFTDLHDVWAYPFASYINGLPDTTSETNTARWRALKEQHHATTNQTARPVTLGPLDAPAYVSEDCITWSPPTGWRPSDEDYPADAIPDHPIDVWLGRDHLDGFARGWIRTIDSAFAPLPVKSQWGVGALDVTVLRALGNTTSFARQNELDQALPYEYESELTRLLSAARQPHQQLGTMPWPTFLELTRTS